MGSIAAASYPAHQDSNAFPVKSEYNSYEDQHQLLHSSGEESGTASENRGSQDGPYGAADGEGTRAAFALGSMGPASNQNLTSGATNAGKDAVPISKRTLQNRKAQREFRQRRATYLKDLEAKVRRFEAGEPAGVHPEVQHRINHLVQEIQYLRAIIDRLQQENAELRRSEAFNSPHQSLPAAGQGAYTLHPPYPSNSLERSPEGYGGNSLALAEMLQPGSYTTSFVGRAQHQDSESSHPGYPVPSPSHGHHTAQPSSPRNSALYQSQQQMDWSTVRHASGGDRAKPASRDGIPSRTLQHSDHGQGDPPQSYLYHSQHQGNAYYQPSTRPPAVRTDGSANNTHHQASHSTSPSSAEPPSAGAIGNSYAGYNAAHSGANGQPQGTALQSPALPDSNPSWHVAGASHLNFHQLGPSLDDAQEYHYHQQQHGHPTQSSFQQHPRSVTQSPVAGVH